MRDRLRVRGLWTRILLAIAMVATVVPVAVPAVAVEHLPALSLTAVPNPVEVTVSDLLAEAPDEAPPTNLCVTLSNPTTETVNVRVLVEPSGEASEHVQAWYNDGTEWVDVIEAGFFGPSGGFEVGPGYTETTEFHVRVNAPFTYNATIRVVDAADETIEYASETVVFTGTTEVVPEPLTIAEVLEADEGQRFTTLLAALEAAGLSDTFADPEAGPFTLLAPTDDAFDELIEFVGEDVWEAILEDTELLGDILAYHVLPGLHPSEHLMELEEPTRFVTLLDGAEVEIEFVDGAVIIDGYAMVIEADIEASNGLIHVIDSVLVPDDGEEPFVSARLAGDDRYETALEIAREAYPGYAGVTHVVVASGADRSAVDALSAAGLTGVLDAPLLLVRPDSVPTAVRDEIAGMPSNVTVHIVGGPAAVSNAVRDQLAAIARVTTVHRVSGADRYETARAVAAQMNSTLVARGQSLPNVALLANGAEVRSFFDALALSPISAANNYPVLLLQRNAIPAATSAALTERGLTTRIVGGGPAVVSDAVVTALGAPSGATVQRWWGQDRYETAATIATNAVERDWASFGAVGVAATLPDALTGGSAIGSMGGVLLLTRTTSVPQPTADAISDNADDIFALYVFGGPAVVNQAVFLELEMLASGMDM